MTHSFHNVQAPKSADKVDGAKNDLCHKAVNNPHTLKYSCPIVEKIICARQLLEALERHAKQGAVEGLPFWSEASNPPGLEASLSLNLPDYAVDFIADKTHSLFI